MELTAKELWTVIHGMLLGSIYLLAFTGGLVNLWNLKPVLLTDKGLHVHLRRLRIGMWIMTIICWLAVITGTYIIFPWYHGGTQNFLLATPEIVKWDTIGMEWKIHVGWLAPILMTSVAFVVSFYGIEIIHRPILRNTLIFLFFASFVAAGIAAIFGAFITKIAPINLGDYLWNTQKMITR